MATLYGDTVNHHRARCEYTRTQTNTAVTVQANAGMESVEWGFSLLYGPISGYLTLTGQEGVSWSGQDFTSSSGETKYTSYASKTWTVARTTSAQTLTLTVANGNWGSGYMEGTSTGSTTVTVDALQSYAVTYNANGGSGAPSAQVKWYGRDLTLSSARPTRAGYTFLGWATSSTATSAGYQPGSVYSANSALALYAIWKSDHVAPTISSLTVYRSTSAGAASESGTYARVSVAWSTNGDPDGTTTPTGKTCTFEWKAASATSWTSTSASLSGTSGTQAATVGGGSMSTSSTYQVRVTVTDSNGLSASATGTVAPQFATLDVGNSGRSVGVGQTATSTAGVDCAMDARFTGSVKVGGRDVQVLAPGLAGCSSTVSSSTALYWRKAASCTVTANYVDLEETFLVASGYNTTQHKHGILCAHVRTNSLATPSANADLTWHYAGEGIVPSDFVLLTKLDADTCYTAELWVRNTQSYQVLSFVPLTSRNRVGVQAGAGVWTVHEDNNASGGQASLPGTDEGYTQVASTVLIGAPKALYSSTSGTTGTVALSETAANFTYLDIFFGPSAVGHATGSVRVWSPSGRSAVLSASYYVDSSAVMQTVAKRVAVSGTSVTAMSGNSAAYANVGSTCSAAASSVISIFRVEGFR